jgi:hypothetical protein
MEDRVNLSAWWKLQMLGCMTNTFQHFVRAKEFVRGFRERSVHHHFLCIRLQLEKNLITHMENTICTFLISLGLNSVLSSLQMDLNHLSMQFPVSA